MEIVCAIGGLAIVLIAVAMIGHGLWLFGAWLTRAGTYEAPRIDLCPKCARRIDSYATICRTCGFPLGGSARRTLAADLEATERQIDRLVRSGRLSESSSRDVREAIRQDQLAWARPSAVANAVPQPSSVEAAVPAAETSTPLPATNAPPVPVPSAIAPFATTDASVAATHAGAASAEPFAVEPMPREDEPRGLAGILKAFMDEKNIRWGELVSGLLIVGSSVGLVISLWATLKEAIPYFPVVVFLGATASMHGAGLYTLRRWRLRSTSRGLLFVSTLLVPLNVLAAIALNDQKLAYETIDYIAFMIGLAALAAISWSAARVLNKHNPWPLTVSVTGTSVSLALIGRLSNPNSTELQTLGLFFLPFCSFLAGAVAQLGRLCTGRILRPRRAAQSFRFLGLSSFAVAIAIGMLAWKHGDVVLTLSIVAPLVSVIAATIAGIGLAIHRRITDPAHAGYRTAGTAVAIGGGLLVLAAGGFAWPHPARLVAVSLLDAASLIALAEIASLPFLHFFAMISLSLAGVVGFQWGVGNISIATASGSRLSELLLRATSALILSLIALAADGIGALLARFKNRERSAIYFLSGSLEGLASVAIATWTIVHNAPDRNLATIVLMVQAARWLVAIPLIRRPFASWIGSILLFATLADALALNPAVREFLAAKGWLPDLPWTTALLLHATICAALAGAHKLSRSRSTTSQFPDTLVRPFHLSALIAAAVVVPSILNVLDMRFFLHGGLAFWDAAILFVVAAIVVNPVVAALAQVLATFGVVAMVTGHCRTLEWWTDRYLDPRHINWQAAALAAWCTLLNTVRWLAKKRSSLERLFTTTLSVDRIVLGFVVTGFVLTALVTSLPGVQAELTSRTSTMQEAWTGVPGDIVAVPMIGCMVATLAFFLLAAVAAGAAGLFPKQSHESAAIGIVFLVIVAAAALSAPVLKPGRLAFAWHDGGPSGSAWIALALALLAMGTAHWERASLTTIVGLAALLAVIPFLSARHWEAELAAASALRYASAVGTLIVAAVWAGYRQLWRAVERTKVLPALANVPKGSRALRDSLIVALSLPLLAITLRAAINAGWAKTGFVGPDDTSIFARMSVATSYTVPVAVFAVALLIIAFRDRQAVIGLAAVLLAEFAVGLHWCLAIRSNERPLTFTDFVRFLQMLGVACGVATALWMALEALVTRTGRTKLDESRDRSISLGTQIGLVTSFACILAIGNAFGLLMAPVPLFNCVKQSASPLGWLLLAIAGGIWFWMARSRKADGVACVALALLALAVPSGAVLLAGSNTPLNWLSFHTAMGGWCALSVAAVGFACVPQWKRHFALVARQSLLLMLPIVLFALRGEWADPLRPWWSASAVLSLVFCATALAIRNVDRSLSYLALGLMSLASVFVGLRPWLDLGLPVGPQAVVDFIQLLILGGFGFGLVWLVVELHWQQRGIEPPDLPIAGSSIPPHHFVAISGTFVAGLTALGVFGQSLLLPELRGTVNALHSATPLGWSVVCLPALLGIGALWERKGQYQLPVLYVLGLIGILTTLDVWDFTPRKLVFTAAAGLAGYLLLVGLLWFSRAFWQQLGARFGAASDGVDSTATQRWLSPANLTGAGMVVCVEFWVVLTFPEIGLRWTAPFATLLVAIGLALLASTALQSILQVAALLVGTVAVVQFGWGIMNVGVAEHELMRRVVRLMTMLATTTAIYGVVLVRVLPKASTWFAATRRVVIGLAGAATAALAMILLLELQSFDPTFGSPVTPTESILVGAALVGLCAGLISLALLPGRDPLFGSQRQRFLYVYASEAVAGLLFAHLYLTNPYLFRQTLRPYWPLIVMAIAYLGTGISELFARLKVKVLSQPLENTAAFLPVLPIIGFWLWRPELSYSTTLVAVGLLYLFLSLRRGSLVYTIAAALVGNATLWALFNEHGVLMLLHPQMFVIPPCVTVLIAAQINRDRLGEPALSAARYFAITMIYVSSTGEMFENGIGETLWLPMVLAGLSVAGVLAGIMLRIRAFLFLGTAFLMLSIVSMVWHAARHIGHVWPWWVFSFTLGLALLIVFGVFEKKRSEVLAQIERLRQWER